MKRSVSHNAVYRWFAIAFLLLANGFAVAARPVAHHTAQTAITSTASPNVCPSHAVTAAELLPCDLCSPLAPATALVDFYAVDPPTYTRAYMRFPSWRETESEHWRPPRFWVFNRLPAIRTSLLRTS